MKKLAPFGCVYRITCSTTGKVYIGLTRDYVSERWYQHRKAAADGASSALYQAMRKHGIEAFAIEPLASALSLADLPELERLLIEQHGSYGSAGYNMSRGGESAYDRRFTPAGLAAIRVARNKPEARRANSARQRDRMATDEGRAHQRRMVEAARGAVDNLAKARSAYAKTEQGKSQIAEASRLGAQRSRELHSKAVVADGIIYASVREASAAFGIERAAVRWRCKSPRFNWQWAA